jgi:DNA-directed RNA polymerase subunit RPC12/RpoP
VGRGFWSVGNRAARPSAGMVSARAARERGYERWCVRGKGEYRGMPTLFVKCRACGREFPTPVAEPSTGAGGVMITGLELRCPKCGHSDQYSTADFHVLPGSGGPPFGGGGTAQENLTSEHEAKGEVAQEKLAGFGVVNPEDRPTNDG